MPVQYYPAENVNEHETLRTGMATSLIRRTYITDGTGRFVGDDITVVRVLMIMVTQENGWSHLVRSEVRPAVGCGKLKEALPCVVGRRSSNVGDQPSHSTVRAYLRAAKINLRKSCEDRYIVQACRAMVLYLSSHVLRTRQRSIVPRMCF